MTSISRRNCLYTRQFRELQKLRFFEVKIAKRSGTLFLGEIQQIWFKNNIQVIFKFKEIFRSFQGQNPNLDSKSGSIRSRFRGPKFGLHGQISKEMYPTRIHFEDSNLISLEFDVSNFASNCLYTRQFRGKSCQRQLVDRRKFLESASTRGNFDESHKA